MHRRSLLIPLSIPTLALPLLACAARNTLHVYEDLAPRTPRGEGCAVRFLDELDPLPDRCELIGDVYHELGAGSAFSCDWQPAWSAFRAAACGTGANLIRARIAVPCASARGELFDCRAPARPTETSDAI